MLLDSITVNVSTTSSVYMLLLNDKDVYEFSHLYMHVYSIYTILNFNVTIMKICIARISSPKI